MAEADYRPFHENAGDRGDADDRCRDDRQQNRQPADGQSAGNRFAFDEEQIEHSSVQWVDRV